MVGGDAHPHLISLLATYEQFGSYFLIFPWADGDLTNYWRTTNPSPTFDANTVLWVARQCEGLASGLLKIHQYQTSNLEKTLGFHEKRWGRHGDLKPENILWFDSNEGVTLKITDFGLSEYSTNHSRSYRPKNSVAFSMSYRAPESDFEDGKIGQSYDIWTLGCLYLEFITWLLGGWPLVTEFAQRRSSHDPMWSDVETDTFFNLFTSIECDRTVKICAEVKPSVKKASVLSCE
jgi:serine/threonine protein kinase